MSFSRGYAGRQAAQPDNTYVNIDSYRASGYSRVVLYCCLNSSSGYIGSFTEPTGSTYSSNFREIRVHQYGSSSEYAGCIRFEGYKYRYSYLNYNPGVYTCNIRDSSGVTHRVNFAVYSQSSKLWI